MLEIVCNKVNKNFGNKEVLKDINFEIKTNEKIALIGQNGCGKTTLLKLIAKNDTPTSGDIFVRKDASIGILTQQPNNEWNEQLVKDIIYSSLTDINILKEKLKQEEEKMLNSTDDKLNKCIEKYTKLQDEFIKIGGYEIDSKIAKIVAAFKVESLLDKKYKFLSGGEKTIINLITILVTEPDILLLDEPTNHLDIDMIEWLENFLRNLKKTVLIVSHDRYFLDKTVNKIILIDNKEAEIFHGNYSYYLEENERRLTQEFNAYKSQQKQIEEMKKAIKRLKEFGRLAYPCGEKFFRRAASIEKRLEKIDIIEKPQNQKNINLQFNVEKRSGNDVLNCTNYSLTIDNKNLLVKTSFYLKYQERVCLMGKNSTGKSTFIKEIINRKDNIKLGSNLSIGYIPQDINFEDEDITVLDEAKKHFIGTENILRSALSKFLFYSNGIYTKLNKLSGGERLRLKLFCLMQKNNNFLIFDEPTNHIDINTKEILEDTILNYKGTVLMISHDRYFINKVATRIVNINNKKFISYLGNYDDYKLQILKEEINN